MAFLCVANMDVLAETEAFIVPADDGDLDLVPAESKFKFKQKTTAWTGGGGYGGGYGGYSSGYGGGYTGYNTGYYAVAPVAPVYYTGASVGFYPGYVGGGGGFGGGFGRGGKFIVALVDSPTTTLTINPFQVPASRPRPKSSLAKNSHKILLLQNHSAKKKN